jgi:hypothetical protein
VEQCVSVTCTLVEAKDGVTLWLTKESGLMPTCVDLQKCLSCTTELVPSQLRRSYVVLRSEYFDSGKAVASAYIAVLSARVLKVVAQEVVPVITASWSWRKGDLYEELSVLYRLESLVHGMFRCEEGCSCSFREAAVCGLCKGAILREGMLFITQNRFRGANKLPNEFGPCAWWTGVTGAAECIGVAAVRWLRCPLSR